MNFIVNAIMGVYFILGAGYGAKSLFFDVEKSAIKKIDKGLSKSEPFAQRLTGRKLPF